MGHEIGLHVHLGGLKNIDDIEDYVLDDISTLEKYSLKKGSSFNFKLIKEVINMI